MNPQHLDFLNEKKLRKLWSSYPELEPTVNRALLAVLQNITESQVFSGDDIKFFGQEVMSKALECTPIHQLQKVSHRIQESLKYIINWAEDLAPDGDFLEARAHVNYFESLEAYAKKFVKSGDYESVLRITDLIQQQKVGQSSVDSKFISDIFGCVVAENDIAGLDMLVETLAHRKGIVLDHAYPQGLNISPDMLIHTIRQVGTGTYDISVPDVRAIVSGVFQAVCPPHSETVFSLAEKVTGVIDKAIPDGAEKTRLISAYNLTAAMADDPDGKCRSIARFFTPASVLGCEVKEEIKAILANRHDQSWRREVALQWCRTFDPRSINLNHHVLRALSESAERNNNAQLPHQFKNIFDGFLNLSKEGMSDTYVQSSYDDSDLQYDGPAGEIFLKLLKDFVRINVVTSSGGLAPRSVLPREMLIQVERREDHRENFLYLWAMLTACGVQNQAREFLADFYDGNYKSLDFWIKNSGDQLSHYSKFEWVNEVRLQADLGL
jgi:hypothetical protein